MSGKFYVYEHWRTDRGECFYVGKGHGRRAYDMRRGRNRWHKFLQAKLSALGTAIEIKIVKDGLSEREAFDIEVERIAFWKNDGADLCNLTLGGDGPSGRKHTEEWKQANSVRMKGRKWKPESRARMSESMRGNKNGVGQIRTPEQIERIAALNRGKERTPEIKSLLSKIRRANPTFKGKRHTPENIAIISAKQIGVPKKEWVKERMRGIPKSEEHRNKIRVIRLGSKHTPETLAILSDSAKRGWENRRKRIAMIKEI